MSDTSRTLFLLDGMALAYRSYFGMIRSPRTTSTGLNVSMVFVMANTIQGILSRNRPTHIAAVFDTRNRHTATSPFRHTRRTAMPCPTI